jgi:hypothetical protein
MKQGFKIQKIHNNSPPLRSHGSRACLRHFFLLHFSRQAALAAVAAASTK